LILIGIDDTDNPSSGGTGRLARALAEKLRGRYNVLGVTRHQLLVDPRIPFTKKNSCNVVHLGDETADITGLAEEAAAFISQRSLEGSDPAICVTDARRVAGSSFGQAAQTRVIERAEATRLAEKSGCILEELGGTGIGLIGALAGVVLAAGGNDGRYVEVGRVRELTGTVSVQQLLDSGVADVRYVEGMSVDNGEVDCGRGVRPSLVDHRPVVFVARADSRLVAVRDDEMKDIRGNSSVRGGAQ